MLRDAFFQQAAHARATEEVETPAGKFVVHTLDAGEKDELDIAHQKAGGKHFRARLVAATAREADGRPAFTAADVPGLSQCPLPLIEPLVDAALRLNRMTPAAAEALEKN